VQIEGGERRDGAAAARIRLEHDEPVTGYQRVSDVIVTGDVTMLKGLAHGRQHLAP